MLIAQITDLHIGFEEDNPDELNIQRLRAVLESLRALDRAPDLVLATGDLTDNGTLQSYKDLKAIFEDCPWPVWPSLGNHDVRDNFLGVFRDIPHSNGFAHYVIEDGAVRIVVLDTLEEGRHGGGFCDARTQWLDQRLAEAPDRPTLVVAHHPPIPTGIDWMTIGPNEAWAGRLADVLAGHPHVLKLVTGHIHRAISAQRGRTPVWVSPSVAPQVALCLNPITDIPDDRPLIAAEDPGYSLHYWDGTTLISHAASANHAPVLARYGAHMRPLISGLLEEKRS